MDQITRIRKINKRDFSINLFKRYDMKNFNLKKIVSRKKSGGFALLETLLMMGILVVVTVLTVYVVYAKVSEARYINQNSNELMSIHAATLSHIALEPNAADIGFNEIKSHGAYGAIIGNAHTPPGSSENSKTSDGLLVDTAGAPGEFFEIRIHDAGSHPYWNTIISNINSINGERCWINDNNNAICVFNNN